MVEVWPCSEMGLYVGRSLHVINPESVGTHFWNLEKSSIFVNTPMILRKPSLASIGWRFLLSRKVFKSNPTILTMVSLLLVDLWLILNAFIRKLILVAWALNIRMASRNATLKLRHRGRVQICFIWLNHWPTHTPIKLWPMAINYAVWVYNHLMRVNTGLLSYPRLEFLCTFWNRSCRMGNEFQSGSLMQDLTCLGPS